MEITMRNKELDYLAHGTHFIFALISGLYLFSFGFFQIPNRLGEIDAILPYEWALWQIVGAVLLMDAFYNVYKMVKILNKWNKKEEKTV